MVSITSWLDPILNFFADKAGLPRDEHNAYVGGEIDANLAGIPTNLLSKGWLNKFIHFLAGVLAAGYGVFGKDVPPRLRRELIAFGEHELWRIAELRPEDIQEIKSSFDNFLNMAMSGNWSAALAQVLRTPAELFAALGLAPSATVTPPPPAVAQPFIPTPAPAPATQQPAAAKEPVLTVI